jgi:hypothetical protein
MEQQMGHIREIRHFSGESGCFSPDGFDVSGEVLESAA